MKEGTEDAAAVRAQKHDLAEFQFTCLVELVVNAKRVNLGIKVNGT